MKPQTSVVHHLSLLIASTIMVGLVSACASHIPESIRVPPAQEISVSQVQQDAEAYKGQSVRWGGIIIELENKKSHSLLKVLAKPLSRYGQPYKTDESLGRFMVRLQDFLDPAVYENNREITVVGTIEAMASGTVGNYSYRYPVVSAQTVYLWPPEAPVSPYNTDPFWPYYPYSPWDPWYPWGYYPYPYIPHHHH